MNWFILILMLAWIYVLFTMKRAKMGVFYFITGSVGTLIFALVIFSSVLTAFLQKSVSLVAGAAGSVTGLYESYFEEGILFIQNGKDNLSMYIDFECSGVIEILAFLSLLWFFDVYNAVEKIAVSIAGVLAIFASNVIRIFTICVIIREFGSKYYFAAHTIIGRILFYILMVLLYFYVFTRPQIVRQKVGAFEYERN